MFAIPIAIIIWRKIKHEILGEVFYFIDFIYHSIPVERSVTVLSMTLAISVAPRSTAMPMIV